MLRLQAAGYKIVEISNRSKCYSIGIFPKLSYKFMSSVTEYDSRHVQVESRTFIVYVSLFLSLVIFTPLTYERFVLYLFPNEATASYFGILLLDNYS